MTPVHKERIEYAARKIGAETYQAITEVSCSTSISRRIDYEIGFMAGAEWQAANPPELGEDVKETVEVLRAHNKWRRGEPGEMGMPRIIGESIDKACDAIESMTTQLAAKDAEIAEMKRLINHLSDDADGWKGRATGND